ncbi:MAG: integrase [Acidobacteria bacterium]|nr:MAG: integrase [Acidobacteriota bacterium]
MIDSLQHECLRSHHREERTLVRRHPQRYLVYYHDWRTHLSLDKDAPVSRAAQLPACGTVVAVLHLGGLHHHYERRAV